jgi:hypothetical protein
MVRSIHEKRKTLVDQLASLRVQDMLATFSALLPTSLPPVYSLLLSARQFFFIRHCQFLCPLEHSRGQLFRANLAVDGVPLPCEHIAPGANTEAKIRLKSASTDVQQQ